MYSYKSDMSKWPNINNKEGSSSSSSCEYPVTQKIVTALIEPLPEEKLKTGCNNIKTKNSQTVTRRKQCIDFDRIEVCNPINSHQIYKEQEKRQINITRTLMQLNQNVDNKISKKDLSASINNNESSNKNQWASIKKHHLNAIKSKSEFKENTILTQKEEAEVQDKQKRKTTNLDTNTQDGWSPSKKQRTTKLPHQNIENLDKSIKFPKLLAKESSSESYEETAYLESEELQESSEEVQDSQTNELEINQFIELDEESTINTNISKENQTNVNKRNKYETTNCSIGSSRTTAIIPKISRTINSNITETDNSSNSNLDKNENYSNSECNTLITEWIITAQKNDTNSVIRSIGEAVVFSHANNVKTLLEVIHQPVDPSLVNLYDVLMQLNDKLSNYLKKE
ncbi:hypothetical protein ILUMI_26491 [Ignelater luminosus]|uniref:Uncharacterized protein n=1 Tax=Ignelater luminosus TaxID=2038154 RepID=A0A8K0C9P9_IGNLU|nr:hypothetical protein ILUMI_26491 [Ignelater luminosus]